MNAKLNFLPWRQEIRARKKKQYIYALQATAVSACLTILAVHLYTSSIVDNKQSRIDYIKNNIMMIDGQIDKIKTLKGEKINVIERMKIIKSLETDRPIIVHMFDDLTRLIPDGIYITELDLQDDVMKIKGVSSSNNKISNLMRSLDASRWFYNPKLISVHALSGEAITSNVQQDSEFELSVLRSKIDLNLLLKDNNVKVIEGKINE